MNKYLFNEKDFEFIRLIKSKIPKKIWFNVIEYILDYEDSYIKITIKPTRDPALNRISQTYEMTTEFSVENSKFCPNELSILLSQGEKLYEIYLVRALVYHSVPHKPDKKETKTLNRFLNSINPLTKQDSNSILNNIDKITYDFVVHPHSVIPEYIKPEHINLVDVGILICLKDNYIRAFSEDNNDDFCNYNETYIYKTDDFEILKQKYELIKVE